MKTTMRLLWWFTLVAFTSSCSSYTAATSPRTPDQYNEALDCISTIEIGDQVRVTLIENVQIKGEVTAISPQSLTLYPDELFTYGVHETGAPDDQSTGVRITISELGKLTIGIESIQAIEKKVASGWKTMLLTIGIIGGIFGVLGLLIAASGGIGVDMSIEDGL